MTFVWLMLITLGLAFVLISCCFFSAKVAQMKLRSKAWGIFGLLLGPIGFVAVCFLPSRRGDGAETNMLRHILRSLPKMSRRTMWVMLSGFALVLVGLYTARALPRYLENRAYEKSVGTRVQDTLYYVSTVPGKPQTVLAQDKISYVITQSGDLYGWGYSNLTAAQQQAGVLESGVKSVAAIGEDTYILRTDGKLYKKTNTGEPVLFAENVTTLRVGTDNGFIVKETGDVYMWGQNHYGQLGTGDTKKVETPLWLMSGVSDVRCGTRHTVILKQNGEVMVCGSNINGALGLKDKANTMKFETLCADASAVAAGADFTLVLTKDGKVLSCGAQTAGCLGRDTEKQSATLLGEVMSDVTAIGAAGHSAFAITGENRLMTWGQNNCGQLGHDGNRDSDTPKKAADNIQSADISATHLLAVTVDGRVVASGDNRYGQMGKRNAVYDTLTVLASFK